MGILVGAYLSSTVNLYAKVYLFHTYKIVLYKYKYYIWVFVCLFAVNAKTTARIDAKCSGITKNDLESVLCGLKSPVFVFSWRYCDVSGFSFTADRHFYLFPFHFWLLPRLHFNRALSPKRRRLRATSLLIIRPTKEIFTSRTKMLCLHSTN